MTQIQNTQRFNYDLQLTRMRSDRAYINIWQSCIQKGNRFEIPLESRHFGDQVPEISDFGPRKVAQLRTLLIIGLKVR